MQLAYPGFQRGGGQAPYEKWGRGEGGGGAVHFRSDDIRKVGDDHRYVQLGLGTRLRGGGGGGQSTSGPIPLFGTQKIRYR